MALTKADEIDFDRLQEAVDFYIDRSFDIRPADVSLKRIRENYERMREGRPTLAQQGDPNGGLDG